MEHPNYQRGTVKHDPRGYAPNMGWTLVGDAGQVLYRGPEWAVKLRHNYQVRLDTGMTPRPTD